MAHLLIIIMEDLKRLPSLLEAWKNIGVPGATILKSAGAYRVTTWFSKVGLGAINRLFETEEGGQRTIIAVIEDEELLSRAIAEAEQVMDGFDRPHSGLLLVMPITQVKGLHKVQLIPEADRIPSPIQPECSFTGIR